LPKYDDNTYQNYIIPDEDKHQQQTRRSEQSRISQAIVDKGRRLFLMTVSLVRFIANDSFFFLSNTNEVNERGTKVE